MTKAEFNEDHFLLYEKYIERRHHGGGMEDPDPNSYMDFLTASWADTSFIEFRRERNLMGVAVIDHLEDGLSAVYTFFDPDLEDLSPGRYAILKEIELTAQLGLQWLYMGYWIKDCRKMSYKAEYIPHQKFIDGQWQDASD